MPQTPEQCQSLPEIRAEMDRIDREIISAIARRVEYVRSAARFKTSAEDVAAPERVQAVLDTRAAWAREAGLDEAVIRNFYSDLVSYSIGEERKRWLEMNAR